MLTSIGHTCKCMHGSLWETYPRTSLLFCLKAVVKQFCLAWKCHQVNCLLHIDIYGCPFLPLFLNHPHQRHCTAPCCSLTGFLLSSIHFCLSLSLSQLKVLPHTSHNYTLDTKWSLNIQNFFLHTSTIHIFIYAILDVAALYHSSSL